jgi:putative transposase
MPIEIWFEDEARIGQKNGLVRQWAKRGTRPRQPGDQRYDNAYLFGAICPARGVGAALALPYADTDMMQLHLDEISRNVAEGAHAVLLLDRAGWHITGKLDVPDTITPIFLPSRAPELNPVENVWQYLLAAAPELALKHRLRKLRRHRRRRMRSVAQTHPRLGKDHIHRNARVDPRRSAAMTLGVILSSCVLAEAGGCEAGMSGLGRFSARSIWKVGLARTIRCARSAGS